MDDLPLVAARLSTALREAGIPHALGGAIALAFHAPPRATIEFSVGSFAPGRSTKPTSLHDLVGVFGDGQGPSAATAFELVKLPDLGGGIDGDAVGKAPLAQLAAKSAGVPVRAVDQDHSAGNAIGECPVDHVETELELGLELDIVGDARLFASRVVIGPVVRQI